MCGASHKHDQPANVIVVFIFVLEFEPGSRMLEIVSWWWCFDGMLQCAVHLVLKAVLLILLVCAQ